LTGEGTEKNSATLVLCSLGSTPVYFGPCFGEELK
jgi:hypothetical protein